MQRKSKLTSVISHVQANYEDWELKGWVIWRIALECDVCISTIYRAIKCLRDDGRIQTGKLTRREWIDHKALLPYFRNEMALFTKAKYETIQADLFCSSNAIYQAIRWGLLMGDFERLNGGSYGDLLRLKGMANAA